MRANNMLALVSDMILFRYFVFCAFYRVKGEAYKIYKMSLKNDKTLSKIRMKKSFEEHNF